MGLKGNGTSHSGETCWSVASGKVEGMCVVVRTTLLDLRIGGFAAVAVSIGRDAERKCVHEHDQTGVDKTVLLPVHRLAAAVVVAVVGGNVWIAVGSVGLADEQNGGLIVTKSCQFVVVAVVAVVTMVWMYADSYDPASWEDAGLGWEIVDDAFLVDRLER